MPALTPNWELNYLPRLPRRKDFRIGCVGAGFIMRDCHLVAYRQAGFNPIAIASREPAHAQAVAEFHAIPRYHSTVNDLLQDKVVEVLDIAVPPNVQPDIIRQAGHHADHIRGILAQKPLAMTYGEAKECVDSCSRAGITLAVNQNMRYDQSVRALHGILQRGILGQPILGTIEMRAIPHWMPWSEELPSLSTFIMSIHHLDTFRYWFGTPDRVMASTRPDPRTRFPHEDGINLYILEYDNGAEGRPATGSEQITAHPSTLAPSHIYIRWRVEGTDGLAQGTIGWPSYPARTPSTLDLMTNEHPGQWFQPRWPEVWFPDAFAGTMAQLLCSLEDGQEPEISGRDNLETIALCEAVRASAKEHRVTTVREFLN
jgi:predicted dehydrogenase